MNEFYNLKNAVWNEVSSLFTIYDPDEKAMKQWGAKVMRNKLIRIIDEKDAAFLLFTELLDEHPEGWDGPCLCGSCKSSGDIEEE